MKAVIAIVTRRSLRLSLLFGLLSMTFHAGLSQRATDARKTTIGILQWSGDTSPTLYFTEMNYPKAGETTIWQTEGDGSLRSVLKEGMTYKADIWQWEEWGHKRLEMAIGFGDYYIGFSYIIPWRPTFRTLGCKGPRSEAQAVTDGLRHCNASDDSSDSPSWRDSESINDLSPREQFQFYCLAYKQDVWSAIVDDDPYLPDRSDPKTLWKLDLREMDSVLEKLGQLLPQLTPPPEIPEEARKTFIEGTTLLKNGDPSTSEMRFKAAEDAAPWWADAFYNRAQALRAQQRYDDATEDLKRYSLLNQSATAKREVLDITYAMGAEKEVDEKKQQEELAKEAVQYVSGGAERLKERDTPEGWVIKDACGIQCLYTYSGYYYYPNVFHMPDGRYLAILLEGSADDANNYNCDKILVAEITEGHIKADEYSFGALNEQFQPGTGATYKISVSERSDTGVVSVTESNSGASVTLPMSVLYYARYFHARQLRSETFYPKIGD